MVMEKLSMETENIVDKNVEQIGKLFPNAVTESGGKLVVDFDILRQELSKNVVDGGQERYAFTWPNKRKAILMANLQTNAALRPCENESDDFETTGNLYIEGDNLDILKLLRETYLNKIKMIYIDPPYNTGKDFIYKDKFTMSQDEYDEVSGEYDEDDNRLFQNTENNGRFHTDWLNMMYPRLKLARDLLTDDGVIFISIDDKEVHNLRKICDEIFGSGNFVAEIIVQTNPRGRTLDKHIAKTNEYIIVFTKTDNQNALFQIPKTDKAISKYNKNDERGKYRLLELRNRNPMFNRKNRPNMFFPIFVNEKTLNVSLKQSEQYSIPVFPLNSKEEEGCWTWGFEKASNEVGLLFANYANTGKWRIFRKDYLEGSSFLTKSKSLWTDSNMNHEYGKELLGQLFEKTIFDFPKSVEYIKKCIKIGSDPSSIILDFFPGSATTAHAVMQLNSEDGGNRKFIMVQLPEKCEEKSEAFKAGYKNICEIGKERIRRAGKKIKDELASKKTDIESFTDETIKHTAQTLDTGFRVLKLASSNMQDIYYKPDDYSRQNIEEFIDNVKPGRTPLDLLFQIMLDLGVSLSSKITSETIDKNTVYSVVYEDINYIKAVLDDNATESVVTAIAKSKPYYAVLKNTSIEDDSMAVNFEQIFKAHSPETKVKVL